MKLLTGYVRNLGFMDYPEELIKLCYLFCYIVYKWDPSSKPNEIIKINKKCDTVMINDVQPADSNIFGDKTLDLDQIHIIDFMIHKCTGIYLGICDVDECERCLQLPTRYAEAFWRNKHGYGYYSSDHVYNGCLFNMIGKSAKKYRSGDRITMIVDLVNGKLLYQLNGQEIDAYYVIEKHRHYKIAITLSSYPNKVEILP